MHREVTTKQNNEVWRASKSITITITITAMQNAFLARLIDWLSSGGHCLKYHTSVLMVFDSENCFVAVGKRRKGHKRPVEKEKEQERERA